MCNPGLFCLNQERRHHCKFQTSKGTTGCFRQNYPVRRD
nr:MAG TPA: hypothetical protein [Caudoviricetes sp.]